MQGKNIVLSFDVEEHHRIEAAHGLDIPPLTRAEYAQRMELTTYRILEQLAKHSTLATFYMVGEIAQSHPKLIQDIANAGHEIGSHSHRHERIHRLTPEAFREDLRLSRDALEQASGTKVSGFRAPTFSIVRETAWAIDVLAELGFRYDSSVFPVRHDRYGAPDAPRMPFLIRGQKHEILELPPATYRLGLQNLPVAGGGYFRLFPLRFMFAGIDQLTRQGSHAVLLYFHPWEFDPEQPRLPLNRLASFRTYVGITKSIARLDRLLSHYKNRFTRAIDLVTSDDLIRDSLPSYTLAKQKAESLVVASQ